MSKKPCAGFAVAYGPATIDIIFYHDDGRPSRSFTRPYYRHWLDKLVAILTLGRGKCYCKQVYSWGWAAWRPDFVAGVDENFQLNEEALGWVGLWLLVGWPGMIESGLRRYANDLFVTISDDEQNKQKTVRNYVDKKDC